MPVEGSAFKIAMQSPQFVDHLVFRVRDLNQTMRFYTAVLDQEPVQSEQSLMYQAGDTRLFFTLIEIGEWSLKRRT